MAMPLRVVEPKCRAAHEHPLSSRAAVSDCMPWPATLARLSHPFTSPEPARRQHYRLVIQYRSLSRFESPRSAM